MTSACRLPPTNLTD
ncbi:hypothetical protein BIW11_07221 [Tropilaelaps mercedesae]|uniref:Uncharacterized protein n=1 Tax=Tropilaelaps mercedesae TaxID=418985 RepID=A0A1V9XV08_9ACAR|nr:hypothetical protein BIW11_07221 [Tropilaelaps mercedesae]